ncbi:MAG: hypothetical protein ABSF82_08790 [Candidatus Bathyarchaeia archaeon]
MTSLSSESILVILNATLAVIMPDVLILKVYTFLTITAAHSVV